MSPRQQLVSWLSRPASTAMFAERFASRHPRRHRADFSWVQDLGIAGFPTCWPSAMANWRC
jgi:protein-disulfide isomerase-like protein with CxxC motif